MEVRRSPELEELTRQARAAVKAGDHDWIARHTADGEVIMFGTAPAEYWRGREQVLEQTRQMSTMNDDAGVTPEFDEVEAYEAGDAGWAVSTGRFRLTDGSSVPFRGIMVAAREDGEWKVGVRGVSVVVSNDLLAPGSPVITPP
jgi:ketosteroid isomerase-like protein